MESKVLNIEIWNVMNNTMDRALNYDVVVIGGGNAALVSAISIADNGAKVLIIEKAPKAYRGGNGRFTRNMRVVHDRHPLLADVYTEEEFVQDVLRVTNGRANLELTKLVARKCRENPEWMRKHGVKFQRPFRGTLHQAKYNIFFIGGGQVLINTYYNYLEKMKNVEIMYETAAKDLVIDGDFCEAVKVDVGGREVVIEGKAFVIASGSFEANLNWLRRYWGDAVDNFIVRGTRYNTGEMLEVLYKNGAIPAGEPKGAHMAAVDARAPKYEGGVLSRIETVPFSIVVNKRCERFYDEGEDIWTKRYAIWGSLIAEQPDQIAFSIFDSKIYNNVEFLPSPWGPYIAPTIEELAKRIGLEPSKLVKTVKEFNAHVVEGKFDPSKLDDCHTEGLEPPKSHWAIKIDSPPFYAYPIRPGYTFCYRGVAVDDKGRVLRKGNVPFKNVFACGETMFGNILAYIRGYLAGVGMCIGTTFGRIVGEEASKVAGY